MKEWLIKNTRNVIFWFVVLLIEISIGTLIEINLRISWYNLLILSICLFIIFVLFDIWFYNIFLMMEFIISSIREFEGAVPSYYKDVQNYLVPNRIVKMYDEKGIIVPSINLSILSYTSSAADELKMEPTKEELFLNTFISNNNQILICSSGGLGKTTSLIQTGFNYLDEIEKVLPIQSSLRAYFKMIFLSISYLIRKKTKITYLPLLISCNFQNKRIRHLIQDYYPYSDWTTLVKKCKKLQRFGFSIMLMIDDFFPNPDSIVEIDLLFKEIKQYSTKIICTTRTTIIQNKEIQRILKKTSFKILELELLKIEDVEKILSILDTREHREEKIEPFLCDIIIRPYEPLLKTRFMHLLRHPLYLFFYLKISAKYKDKEVSIEQLFEEYFLSLKEKIEEKIGYKYSINDNEFIDNLAYWFMNEMLDEKINTQDVFIKYKDQLIEDSIVKRQSSNFFWHSELDSFIIYKIIIDELYKLDKNENFNKEPIVFLLDNLINRTDWFYLHLAKILEFLLFYDKENYLAIFIQKYTELDISSKLQKNKIELDIQQLLFDNLAYTFSIVHGDYKKTNAIFDFSEKLGNPSVHHYCLRINNELNFGNISKMQLYAQMILRIDTNNITAYGALGVSETLKRNFIKAIEYQKKGLNLKPENKFLAKNLAIAQNFSSKCRESLQTIEKYFPQEFIWFNVKQNNKYFGQDIAYLKALNLYKIGDIEQSIELFRNVIKVDSKDVRFRHSLAYIFATKGNFKESLSLFEEINTILKMVYPELYYGWLTVLFEIVDIDRFMELLDDFEQKYPNESRLLFLKGRFSEFRLKNEEAVSYYKASLQQKPLLEEAFRRLITILYREGKYEDALNHIELGLKEFPENRFLNQFKTKITSFLDKKNDIIAKMHEFQDIVTSEQDIHFEDVFSDISEKRYLNPVLFEILNSLQSENPNFIEIFSKFFISNFSEINIVEIERSQELIDLVITMFDNRRLYSNFMNGEIWDEFQKAIMHEIDDISVKSKNHKTLLEGLTCSIVIIKKTEFRNRILTLISDIYREMNKVVIADGFSKWIKIISGDD